MFLFGDSTLFRLGKGLDAAALRQRVIAHNLANLNTPGFKRSAVTFEETLSRAKDAAGLPLARTHERHLRQTAAPAAEPRVTTETDTYRRIDGNNVDIEQEMLEMVANQLRYNSYVQQVNSRFNNWRYVINEGRR
ncbi:MAG: flagellar basal body rod protein FlgB [Bacillota bacterium]